MSLTAQFPSRIGQFSGWCQLVLVVLMSLAGRAWGGCSLVAATPSASFGTASSFVVAGSVSQTSAQPSAGLECTGSVLGLIVSGDYVDATLSSSNGGGLVSGNGDWIGYNIFADAAGQEQLQFGVPYNYYNSYLLGLLGILGGTTASMPMYFSTRPDTASNISAGTYTDSLMIAWNWSVCTGIGVFDICLGRDEGSATSIVTLELEVTPDCAINAPNLEFGSAPLVAGFSSTTSTITIRCTKGENYSVGLNDGGNPLGSQRRMQNSGNYLSYELYKGASGSERWGDEGSERRDSSTAETNPGSADGVSDQGFVLRGVIDTNQSTPPVGIYTDAVLVDVEF